MKRSKKEPSRTRRPRGIRADGNLVIGSVMANGNQSIDVTTLAWLDGRELCLEVRDGTKPVRRVQMSKDHGMAFMSLLIVAIKEG